MRLNGVQYTRGGCARGKEGLLPDISSQQPTVPLCGDSSTAWSFAPRVGAALLYPAFIKTYSACAKMPLSGPDPNRILFLPPPFPLPPSASGSTVALYAIPPPAAGATRQRVDLAQRFNGRPPQPASRLSAQHFCDNFVKLLSPLPPFESRT